MQPSALTPGTSRRGWRAGLFGLFAIAATLIGLTTLSSPPARAAGRPPGGRLSDPVVREIVIASPAVVRIATEYDATLSLSVCGARTTLPGNDKTYPMTFTGSGAFVSGNGDILTADHVVHSDKQTLDDYILQLPDVDRDVARFLTQACQVSPPITAADVYNGILQASGIPITTTYSDPKITAWRSTSFTGALTASAPSSQSMVDGLMKAQRFPATVTRSSEFQQDDLALLRVALRDTPSIQLDKSAEVAVGDSLTIIGFPGNGDLNADPTNLLTPSVNTAVVSAIKRNDNGSPLLQVGGNVEHGDSGGPALDAQGRIVGVVSFGGTDTPGITAFLRASDSAQSLLSAASIDTRPGTFQQMWRDAFLAYADDRPGHWGRAARAFEALNARYPEFRGADSYKAYAQVAAATETDTNTPQLPLPLPVLAAIAGGVMLLVVLLLVTLVVRARRRAAKRRQAAALAAATPAAMPLPSGYGMPAPYSQAPAYPPPGYGSAAPPSGAYPGYPSSPYGSPVPVTVPATPAATSTVATAEAYTSPPSASSSPAPWGHPSGESAPASPTAPWTSPPSDAGPATEAGICENGHSLPSGASRCFICGAPRAAR